MPACCNGICEKLRTYYPVSLVRNKVIESVFDVAVRCNTCKKWLDKSKYGHRCPCCNFQFQYRKRHKTSEMTMALPRID